MPSNLQNSTQKKDLQRIYCKENVCQSDTLKAVDVTFLDVLVRQNDMVYAKFQLSLLLLILENVTFSKTMEATI